MMQAFWSERRRRREDLSTVLFEIVTGGLGALRLGALIPLASRRHTFVARRIRYLGNGLVFTLVFADTFLG